MLAKMLARRARTNSDDVGGTLTCIRIQIAFETCLFFSCQALTTSLALT